MTFSLVLAVFSLIREDQKSFTVFADICGSDWIDKMAGEQVYRYVCKQAVAQSSFKPVHSIQD